VPCDDLVVRCFSVPAEKWVRIAFEAVLGIVVHVVLFEEACCVLQHAHYVMIESSIAAQDAAMHFVGDVDAFFQPCVDFLHIVLGGLVSCIKTVDLLDEEVVVVFLVPV